MDVDTKRGGLNDPRTINLTGLVFGSLTVRGIAGSGRFGALWSCDCTCGQTAVFPGAELRRGRKWCGRCRYARRGNDHEPTYNSWRSMVDRCTQPGHGGWANYGGRGIKIHDRWRDYSAFVADMGERPSGRTLDRINNDGNYEPGNCRWATPAEQRGNRRDTSNTRRS